METMDPTFMHQPALTLSPRLLSLPASAWLPDLLLRKWQVPIQPPFASAETCTAPLFRPLLLPGPIPESSGRPPSAAGRAHPPPPRGPPRPSSVLLPGRPLWAPAVSLPLFPPKGGSLRVPPAGTLRGWVLVARPLPPLRPTLALTIVFFCNWIFASVSDHRMAAGFWSSVPQDSAQRRPPPATALLCSAFQQPLECLAAGVAFLPQDLPQGWFSARSRLSAEQCIFLDNLSSFFWESWSKVTRGDKASGFCSPWYADNGSPKYVHPPNPL